MLHNEKLLSLFNHNNLNNFLYNPYVGIDQYPRHQISLFSHHLTKYFFLLCKNAKLDYLVVNDIMDNITNHIGIITSHVAPMLLVDLSHISYFNSSFSAILLSNGFRQDKLKSGLGVRISFSNNNVINNNSFQALLYWTNLSGPMIRFPDGKLVTRDEISSSSNKSLGGVTIRCLKTSFQNPKDMDEVLKTSKTSPSECDLLNTIGYSSLKSAKTDFNYLYQQSVKNTKHLLKDYETSGDILSLDYLEDSVIGDPEKLFGLVVQKKIGAINCLDFNKFKISALLLKFYLPKLKINLFLGKGERDDHLTGLELFYLNYATNVFVYHQAMKERLDKLVYLKKPKILVTKIITFGTFDTFHVGHENIINKCLSLSRDVVIGVSSDELNSKKNKTALDPIDQRINNVRQFSKTNIIFREESLEKKGEYIRHYKSNVLVMGDDWENKFNSPKYNSLYFQRTPNISSTQIRNEIAKKKLADGKK